MAGQKSPKQPPPASWKRARSSNFTKLILPWNSITPISAARFYRLRISPDKRLESNFWVILGANWLLHRDYISHVQGQQILYVSRAIFSLLETFFNQQTMVWSDYHSGKQAFAGSCGEIKGHVLLRADKTVLSFKPITAPDKCSVHVRNVFLGVLEMSPQLP